MILSRTHKFVFIKGKKVGGTSVEMALSAVCGPHDIVTPITFRDEIERFQTSGVACRNYGADEDALRAFLSTLKTWSPGANIPKHPAGYFRNHMSLAKVQAIEPDVEDFKLLICERSPYEKLVSLANWSLHTQSYNRGSELEISTSVFQARLNEILSDDRMMRVYNIDRYRNLDGALPSFTMLRTTHLQDDFSAFLTGFGLRQVKLPWAKRTSIESVDIRATMTRSQIDLVNSRFAYEFEVFGFARF